MGIYKLYSKKISREYPWIRQDTVKLYMLYPSSDYVQSGYVSAGYIHSETSYKAASIKPAEFYIEQEA